MAKFADPQAEPTPPPTAQPVKTEAPRAERYEMINKPATVAEEVELLRLQLEVRKMDELRDRKENQSFWRYGWRPSMGWAYLLICLFDFVIGPIFYAWYAYYTKDIAKFGEWKPLTLEGGGVFHVAMGAINGVTSWTRGQERIVQEKLMMKDKT